MKKETLKIVISLFVFLGIVLVGNQVLADANSNPIFPTFEQVRQMIAEALGQSPVLPPLTAAVGLSSINCYETECDIIVNVDIWLGGQSFTNFPGESWGIAHLPSGDVITNGIGDLANVNWYQIPSSQMPPEGTPINVDIYDFFAGKTIHLNTDITTWD